MRVPVKLGKLPSVGIPHLPAGDLLRKLNISGYFLWVGIALLAALWGSTLVMDLFKLAQQHESAALSSGQKVIVHIASGETEGNPRHTKQAIEKEEGKGKGQDVPASKEALAPAPLDDISEQTEKGLYLPKAGKDGTVPWKYYSRPFTATEGKPVVAIMFTNLGLSKQLTEEVLKLPHSLTLSFSPYASDVKFWARKARGQGFESMIDIPVEPSNFPLSDPGPYGLLSSLDPSEMTSRIQWVLSRYPGFVGTLANLDEKLTANTDVMHVLLSELTSRGVVFVYQKTPTNGELEAMAKKQNSLVVGADQVLDNDLNPSSILRQLDNLAALAKKQGHAVGIVRAYPPTIRAMQLWFENIGNKGVEVAPLSAIAKKMYP